MKSYDHPYKRFWGRIAGFFYPQKAASGLLSHFSKTWESWSKAIARSVCIIDCIEDREASRLISSFVSVSVSHCGPP